MIPSNNIPRELREVLLRMVREEMRREFERFERDSDRKPADPIHKLLTRGLGDPTALGPDLHAEVRALREEVSGLRAKIARAGDQPGAPQMATLSAAALDRQGAFSLQATDERRRRAAQGIDDSALAALDDHQSSKREPLHGG